jgi:hypothetical protein
MKTALISGASSGCYSLLDHAQNPSRHFEIGGSVNARYVEYECYIVHRIIVYGPIVVMYITSQFFGQLTPVY